MDRKFSLKSSQPKLTATASDPNAEDSPDVLYNEVLDKNSTHFSAEELARLLAAFKRVAVNNKLQGTAFYDIVASEMGWSNLLLRKQLFAAFDRQGKGDINFEEFAMGYSAMLRGTVPELLEFAWRLYHCQGPADLIAVSDMYTVLRLALAGLEEVRRKQGKAAGGPSEDTRFPDRAARTLLDRVFGESTLITRLEFNRAVLRYRRLVDCLIPGFELVPQDPLHAAAAAGEVREVQHLIEVDRLDVDGRDGLQFPTTPLHLACKFGHSDVIRLLMQSGANPRILSAQGETAVELCVKNMRNKALEAMMDQPMDFTLRNGQGQTALHTAARYGNTRALRLLLPFFVSIPTVMDLLDDAGDTPLHAAAAGDHFLAVDVFLEFGKFQPPPKSNEVDKLGAMGKTAAHVAAEARAYRVLKRLLELGADTTVKDAMGRTLLNCASRAPNNESVFELLFEETRPLVNQADLEHVTPLMAAMSTRDLKMVRMLLEKGADANAVEGGTMHTPLHKAVLLNWQEGVEALLAPSCDAQLLRDARGCSPYDYARTTEIAGLLKDYIEQKYTEFDADHPINFDLALVCNDGLWKHVNEDRDIGTDMHALNVSVVSDRVRYKRIKHRLMDPESMIKELRAAGLYVQEERVLMTERVLGIRVGIRQYHVIRIGAPLYRLQLEAMKMRLRIKRRHLDGSAGESEEYYLDQATYPETAFEPFSRAERHRVLFHIIEGEDNADGLPEVKPSKAVEAERKAMEASSLAGSYGNAPGGGDATTITQLRQIKSAGIKLAIYIRYRVVHDMIILHNPKERIAVLKMWSLRNITKLSYWYEQLVEMLTVQRRSQYSYFEPVKKYFGHKFGFYMAFMMYYVNFLIAPAFAGLLVYGLLYVERKPQSQIKTTPENARFTQFYDNPLAFAYAAFLVLWGSFMVRNWIMKERELAFKWKVDDSYFDSQTPNPLSTAKVMHLFVNGRWEYKAVETDAMFRKKIAFIAGITTPVFLFFVALVLGSQYLCIRIVDWIDGNADLAATINKDGVRDRKPAGDAAMYAVHGLSAVFVWLWNWIFGGVALKLNHKENHPTMNDFQWYLSIKLIVFQAINTLITPLYFAYWDKDLDKVGMQIGSLLVVGAVLQNITEYFIPWLKGHGSRPASEEDEVQKSTSFFSRKTNKVMDVSAQPGDSSYAMKRRMSNKDIIVEIGRMASGMNFDKDNQVITTTDEHVEVNKAKDEEDEYQLGVEMDFKNFVEPKTEIRYEVLAEVADTTVEMAEMLMQYTLIMMFGGVWPLCGITAFIFNFFEARLDLWKFCMINRRPNAQRGGSLGRQWTQGFDLATIAGISNHSFMLFLHSQTVYEYFFDESDLDIYYRVFLAFVAQSGFLAVFLLLRLTAEHDPVWIVQARKDVLRYVRDAFRQGHMIREKRRQLMAARPKDDVTLPFVAAVLDIDMESVNRYLVTTRYLESLTPSERRAILLDPNATIQGLVQKLELLISTGQWKDPGEASTLPALERTLMPIHDIGKVYKLGRRFRELCYAAASRVNRSTTSLTAESRGETVLAIRQLAAVELDITLSQAERYCRLVRYIDSLPGNPFQVIEGLKVQFPDGMPGVLRDARDRGWEDPGEPSPFELGDIIEPEQSARKACTKAALIRRRAYDLWIKDSHLLPEELLEQIAEEMGGLREQLERYLLIRRHTDSLEPARRKELLDMAKPSTLLLYSEVMKLIEDGTWRDPGELPLDLFDPDREEALIAEYEMRIPEKSAMTATRPSAKDGWED